MTDKNLNPFTLSVKLMTPVSVNHEDLFPSSLLAHIDGVPMVMVNHVYIGNAASLDKYSKELRINCGSLDRMKATKGVDRILSAIMEMLHPEIVDALSDEYDFGRSTKDYWTSLNDDLYLLLRMCITAKEGSLLVAQVA